MEYTTQEKQDITVLAKVIKNKLQSRTSLLEKAERKLGYLPLTVSNSVINNSKNNNVSLKFEIIF